MYVSYFVISYLHRNSNEINLKTVRPWPMEWWGHSILTQHKKQNITRYVYEIFTTGLSDKAI